MQNDQQKKRVAVFGSTGSVGKQALQVIASNPERFTAEILTAQNNDELLVKQALLFSPEIVVIGDEKKYPKGLRVSDDKLAAVNIFPHDFHGEWNYTIAPIRKRTKR